MKVLAFAATNSAKSINKQLVTHATNILKAENSDVQAEVIDINDYEMPIFSMEREAQLGQPEEAKAFLAKIAEADAVVISFAEHNGSYTAAYKNLFDWASRIEQKVFQDKKTILLSTSPGPGGAKSVLQAAVGSAPYFGAEVKGSLSVPSFYDNFNVEEGTLQNAELDAALKEVVGALL